MFNSQCCRNGSDKSRAVIGTSCTFRLPRAPRLSFELSSMATTSNENSHPAKRCNRLSYVCVMRQSHVNVAFVPEPPPSLQGAPPPYMASPVDYWQPAPPPRILPYQPVHARTVQCAHCYLERGESILT
ncbi:hypothetical protein Y032_0377g274 [Ancylostoma ceylanicum]|uniref:Uncharacterized protein n=1 Tax=Ancylostoma ceylanicum TaxID=53326 RepID=A0A016RTM6_9BILA|nr:hypothetical protein Y032_0377g274 [Ancylostoma ceylanicum]